MSLFGILHVQGLGAEEGFRISSVSLLAMHQDKYNVCPQEHMTHTALLALYGVVSAVSSWGPA